MEERNWRTSAILFNSSSSYSSTSRSSLSQCVKIGASVCYGHFGSVSWCQYACSELITETSPYLAPSDWLIDNCNSRSCKDSNSEAPSRTQFGISICPIANGSRSLCIEVFNCQSSGIILLLPNRRIHTSSEKTESQLVLRQATSWRASLQTVFNSRWDRIYSPLSLTFVNSEELPNNRAHEIVYSFRFSATLYTLFPWTGFTICSRRWGWVGLVDISQYRRTVIISRPRNRLIRNSNYSTTTIKNIFGVTS
jgi:hypothetical protein